MEKFRMITKSYNRNSKSSKSLFVINSCQIKIKKSEELPDYGRGEAIRLFRCNHLRSILDESLTFFIMKKDNYYNLNIILN